MVAKIVDYFKDPENFSILLFLGYVFVLTQLMAAVVMSMCFLK